MSHKLRNALSKNRLMERVCRFGGFQKLLLFCLPVLAAGVGYHLVEGTGLPSSLKSWINSIYLWVAMICWAWDIISFQIHWKQSSRNLAANLSIVCTAVVAIILSLI